MWYYKLSEVGSDYRLYTVMIAGADGRIATDSDWNSPEDASRRAAFLNGGPEFPERPKPAVTVTADTALAKLIAQVKTVRVLQREYFKNRDQSVLRSARAAESILDKLVSDIESPNLFN